MSRPGHSGMLTVSQLTGHLKYFRERKNGQPNGQNSTVCIKLALFRGSYIVKTLTGILSVTGL